MRLLTKKLTKYTLEQLILNAPKIKGLVFSIQQSSDRKGNPTEYWEAMYFSDRDGRIKYRVQAEDPKTAIVALIKQVRSDKKKR